MKMSKKYMEETAVFISSRGYELKKENDEMNSVQDDGQGEEIDGRVRFVLSSESQKEFILECVSYASGVENYFLEIKKYFQLRCFSFPLDSWKYFPDRVEFKFYAIDEPPLGLSFILDLPELTAV